MPKKIEEFLTLFQEKFPSEGFEVDPLNPGNIVLPLAVVDPLFDWLREDEELAFDYFDFCTCVDHPPQDLDMIYSLFSCKHKNRLGLKIRLPRDNPSLPTVSHLWANANWNEREVFDLFGVLFLGHPDLRRIMMPDDWEGHPLRKDYMHPNMVPTPV